MKLTARRPTICLNMIVRDEAPTVRETLETVAAHIDCWVVVDTGSCDRTQDVITGFMADAGIPGELLERPWRNFGHNRTEALEACRGRADYAWVIDADDLLVGDLDLSRLTSDSYLLRYGPEFVYWRKQIFRDGLRWAYRGVVHEHPVCLDPVTEARLEGDYHIRSRRIGARNRNPHKYQHDRDLLREVVERDSQELARSTFYLAQSCFDAGDPREALDWYTRRSTMGGFEEEVFYSLLRRGECLEQLGEPWERVQAAYLQAWDARPTRAEPLWRIASHYRAADEFELGYLFAKRASEVPFPDQDVLFVDRSIHAWRAADELSICAHYIGRHQEAFDVATALLEGDRLPEEERGRVIRNRAFSVTALRNARTAYSSERVRQLAARAADRVTAAEVTLTITSGRRLELFERTINSFLSCCTDVGLIGRWICADTGSSAGERARMRELYPFFEWIDLDPAEAGHAEALNRLMAEVQTPYWLHLEDDWEFIWCGPYVGRALAILASDARLGQVLFNRNYAETIDERIVGGRRVQMPGDQAGYLRHNYIPFGSPEWDTHLGSLLPGELTNAHWPHFSLRPSLVRADVIRSVGTFAPALGRVLPDGSMFEREFGVRYVQAGWESAFFDAVTCLHAGALVSDGRRPEVPSAYELLGAEQPSEVPGVVARDAESPRDERDTPSTDEVEIHVINLERRPDRWRAFQERMQLAAGADFLSRCLRFAAVDGREQVATAELEHLFRGHDFGLRRGFVGCALSHMSVWRQIAGRDDAAFALVLEDDVQPCPGFDRRLTSVVDQLRWNRHTVDLVFLGCSREDPEVAVASAGEACLQPMRWDTFIGGLFAYLISPRGARRLLELAERDGIQNGIDVFVARKALELEVLECVPSLAESPLAWSGGDVDSDIQHDLESLRRAERLRPERRQPLNRLLRGVEFGELRLEGVPGQSASAISISGAEDGFRALIRTRGEGADEPVVNYMLKLDEGFQTRTLDLVPAWDGARWFDGGRLVQAGGAWFASALECAAGGWSRPVLLALDDATVAAVEPMPAAASPIKRVAPAAPFVEEDRLRLVGSWAPLTLLSPTGAGPKMNDSPAGPTPTLAAGFSSGSPGLFCADGWLFVVWDRDAGAHRFARLDRGCRLDAVSPPFSVLGADGESCWGIARRNGDLVLSFGTAGQRAGLALMETESALGLLEPCA